MMIIPLTDASRRPLSFPAVTAAIIGVWGPGGVAYAAHVGGFIFGAVTARLFAQAPLRRSALS